MIYYCQQTTGGDNKMRLNTDELAKLPEEMKWSVPELAKKIGVDYSHLFRVLNKDKGAGVKLLSGVYNLCLEYGLDVNKYIFLSKPLSVNNRNGGQKPTGTTGN
jgi:transcriptional regulator with XRE-family HTH domain